MKGTIFQKPLEFRLTAKGESWNQEDLIEGSLWVKNHGSESVDLSDLKVHLAFGIDKKVKAKDPSAFEIVETFDFSTPKLDPSGQTKELAWRSVAAPNRTITDNAGSLYLLYGMGNEPSKLGHLLVTVKPHRHFQEFGEVLEATHRFVRKTVKNSKDRMGVEMKFAPPSGRDHPSIDQLVLDLRRTADDQLNATFKFTLKRIDASAGMKLKKVKKEIRREFSAREYVQPFNQRLDKDKVEVVLNEIMKETKSTGLFS